jgi:glycosyltransferase involved in cell wall biosynthesis
MRLCHVLESASGGSSKVVLDLARMGLARGDDVTVVYSPERAEPSFVGALHRLSRLKVLETPMRRSVGTHDLVDALRLYQSLRQAGPFDIVHGHSSKAGALVRIVGLALPFCAKVYTPHAFVTLDSSAPSIYRFAEKALSWLCDAVIVVSECEKKHAVEVIGIDPRKIVVVPNGIGEHRRPDGREVRRELGYLEDEVVLGFIGRLSPQKNPRRLVEAFARACGQRADLRLAVVGEGPLRAEFEESVRQRGLGGRARCFGRKDGRRAIVAFDGLVCSSDYEGFPITFLEALAAGVPIVSTPVGGVLECVVQGETGFAADDFSSAGLTRAILQLSELSSEARRLMAGRCRAHVQQFGADVFDAKMQSIYERLRLPRMTALPVEREEADVAS